MSFTWEQIAAHNSARDCWIVIDDHVYDVAEFLDEHPGGEEVIVELAGRDATQDFEDINHSDEAKGMLAKYLVGKVKHVPGEKKGGARASSGAAKKADGGLSPALVAGLLVAAAVLYYVYSK